MPKVFDQIFQQPRFTVTENRRKSSVTVYSEHEAQWNMKYPSKNLETIYDQRTFIIKLFKNGVINHSSLFIILGDMILMIAWSDVDGVQRYNLTLGNR